MFPEIVVQQEIRLMDRGSVIMAELDLPSDFTPRLPAILQVTLLVLLPASARTRIISSRCGHVLSPPLPAYNTGLMLSS